MSQQYDNTNRGVLFENTKKKSEKAPDWEGTLNVGGKDFDLSAWTKTSKNGKKFFSISIKEPWNPQQKQENRAETRSDNDGWG